MKCMYFACVFSYNVESNELTMWLESNSMTLILFSLMNKEMSGWEYLLIVSNRLVSLREDTRRGQ